MQRKWRDIVQFCVVLGVCSYSMQMVTWELALVNTCIEQRLTWNCAAAMGSADLYWLWDFLPTIVGFDCMVLGIGGWIMSRQSFVAGQI